MAALIAVWTPSELAGIERVENPKLADPERFVAIHDRAARALAEGRLDDALVGFDRAIALNPHSAQALYNRGSAHYAKSQYERALVDFTQAINLDPSFGFAYMNRGITYSNLRRYDEALSDLNKAADLNQTGSDALFNRAILFVRRNDLDRALQDYEAALALDSSDAMAARARERLIRQLPVSVDTSLVSREMEHGWWVEHVLRLAEQSCLRYGGSRPELAAFASFRRWQAAHELNTKNITAETVKKWRFSDQFGGYVVDQFIKTDNGTVICSLTTRVVSAHLFDDAKANFDDRIRVKSDEISPHIGTELLYDSANSELRVQFTFTDTTRPQK